ncbi:hypothetical protein Y032_0538g3138 [Ancylostoma ceylanicum]|uniref:7TM GPCR serpentine receptor class x (Srx) domain-containing protein n=1 Tax=Ancylostoma ceylanicum TaxID=53326 RepID=A0A016WRL8_9BILA|nr:hypothetical protein Y032_0538g3138 [Ancylostoma ceylanicum]
MGSSGLAQSAGQLWRPSMSMHNVEATPHTRNGSQGNRLRTRYEEVQRTPTSVKMIAENILASVLLFVVGVPGLYLNMLSTFSLFGAATPFEMICACHAAGNAGVLAVLIFCSAPMIYFGSPWLNVSEFGKMAGRVTMYAWFLIHYTQVLLAINRFMAINCYMIYNKVFSSANTKKILAVLGIYLLWYFFVGFFDGCHFIFLSTTWQWAFEQTQCGLILFIYVDFYFTIGLLITSLAFDFCTAISIYRFVKITASTDRHFGHTDVMFFIQSCMSNFIFIADLSLFLVGPTIYQALLGEAPDTFGIFLINTLSMEISHFLDGLIMVVFNRKTRAYIFNPRKLVKLRLEGSRVSSLARVSDYSHAKTENHDSKGVAPERSKDSTS